MPPSSRLTLQVEVQSCRGTLGRWRSWRCVSSKFRELLHKRHNATSPVRKPQISREEGLVFCKLGRVCSL